MNILDLVMNIEKTWLYGPLRDVLTHILEIVRKMPERAWKCVVHFRKSPSLKYLLSHSRAFTIS